MSEQRYRLLAVGELIEAGDDCKSTENLPSVIYKWGMACGHEGQRVGDVDDYIYRRPIPETNWREPVYGAGYPMPGLVIRLEATPEEEILTLPGGKMRLERGTVWPNQILGSHLRWKVIDYRPDLVNQQNNVGSKGMGICGEEGQPETDPKNRSDETCCSCLAELIRLRTEVERRKASAENLRDFADRFKKQCDEAREEIERLTAELAKHKQNEVKPIDLTQTAVFVGAAWGESEGEIQ